MLSTKEAASRLSSARQRVTSRQVATLARNGVFPGAKKDKKGRWRIPQGDIDLLIEAKGPNNFDSSYNYILAEYNAIRKEILFRLTSQQNTINFGFLILGALAPILGLIDSIQIGILLPILLLGPPVCIFLQSVYLKHHAFIDLMTEYVRFELSHEAVGTNNNLNNPLSGWERHLSNAYTDKRTNSFLRPLGYAEGGFLTLVGIFYLVAFTGLIVDAQTGQQASLKLTQNYSVLLIALAFIDFLTLIIALLVGIRLRRRISMRRQADTAEKVTA